MTVLGIDTSTMTGGAALVNSQGLVGEYVLNLRTTHSERLLPAIQRILADAELTLDQLDGIAVVTGPGSFTGLRIGVATAKGFAYALGKPIVGVTTLAALAWQHQTFKGFIYPLIDAKRQDVYSQVFAGVDAVTEPCNSSIDRIIQWCSQQKNPALFVGDGAVAHKTALAALSNSVFPSSEGLVLRASAVAGLGMHLLSQGNHIDPFDLIPFYMRKSSAEYQRDRAEDKNEG